MDVNDVNDANDAFDAIELAMKMEKDGENFYRELAKHETNIGFQGIFNSLANDEVKHYQLFQSMNQQPVSLVKTEVLKNASNIFKQMVTADAMKNFDSSQLHLYQKAMELEKKSQEYYLENAAHTSNENQKELFQKIAAEEEQHYFLLHNIMELVLRPQTWVENGEFNHLEEY